MNQEYYEEKKPKPEELETCADCGGKFRILKDIYLDEHGTPYCDRCYHLWMHYYAPAH